MPSRALAACLLALACSRLPLRAADTGGDTSGVIAKVGDTEMKADEIRTLVKSLDANAQAAIQRDPAALGQVVRAILTQRLVLQEALAKKWDQDPAVAAQLARVRDNTIAETYLLSVSQPPADYPSDAEVQAAYDANKGALLVPRQFRLAQIFIKAPKNADQAALAKAQVKLDGIKKALKKRDADFAAIARAESDEEASAAKGGELGTLPENRIQPEIRAQLGSLARDSVSDPVRLDDGWHILKVLEVKEPYTAALADVRQQLIQQMRTERTKALSQAYVARLSQQSPVQVNELALAKLLKQP